MTDLTDSMEFFVIYLIVSLTLFGLIVIFYIFYKKGKQLVRLKTVISILIIVSLLFYALSSLSNLGESQIPPKADFKFIYSMIFFFLLCISVYLFTSLFYREDDKYYSGEVEDTNESEMEDMLYNYNENTHTIPFEPKYESKSMIRNKQYQERYLNGNLQELEHFVNKLYDEQKSEE